VSSRDCKQTSNRNTQAFFFAAQIFYLGNDIIDYVKHYLRAIVGSLCPDLGIAIFTQKGKKCFARLLFLSFNLLSKTFITKVIFFLYLKYVNRLALIWTN
jgi:hypothetical protein